VGKLLEQCEAFKADRFDGVFHLASAVSGECEADFELGLRSNLDSTRALLDALRESVAKGGNVPRFVFSSSVAVFGPDASNPMPPLVRDDTLPTPQTSYGTHKLVCEHLVADYTRKGFIDGRSARLPTVIIRPGAPNAAASSFASAVFREPLAGRVYPLPVPLETRVPVIGMRTVVDCLIRLADLPPDALGDDRTVNLPSLSVTVAEMVESVQQVAAAYRIASGRIEVREDEEIGRIVRTWPEYATAERALALGLPQDEALDPIAADYVDRFGGAG
jgi:nucleoside-diphosphate-sugar epimerase